MYTFSTRPGGPGNALIGGHVDWGSDIAVFWPLRNVSLDDRIVLTMPQLDIEYRVVSIDRIAADAPIQEVVGSRTGPETLTLMTCDGAFDTTRKEYNQRLVIRAIRIPAPGATQP